VPESQSKFDAPMFETVVFRKQMYCIEESACDIVGNFLCPPQWFGAPIVICRPKNCADPLPPPRCAPDLIPTEDSFHIRKVDSLNRMHASSVWSHLLILTAQKHIFFIRQCWIKTIFCTTEWTRHKSLKRFAKCTSTFVLPHA